MQAQMATDASGATQASIIAQNVKDRVATNYFSLNYQMRVQRFVSAA